MVPVPTFEKVMVLVPVPFLLLKSYGSCYGSSSISHHKKQIFQEKFRNFFAFLPSKLFYKEKVYKFQQIYCEM
jgi:hypothetical protein